jgi:hypothetical protein
MEVVLNAKIKEVRPMNAAEMKAEYWVGERPPTVLVLDNGTKLYASRDDEGNGPGVLFGVHTDGSQFGLA